LPKLPPRLHRQSRPGDDPRRLSEEDEDFIATAFLVVFLTILASGATMVVTRLFLPV